MKKIKVGFASIVGLLLIIVLVFSFNYRDQPTISEASSGDEPIHTSDEKQVDAPVNDEPISNGTTVQGAEGNPEIIESKFDPSLIEFYTGKPRKFEWYTLDDVKPGVYVNGVKTHSGKQAISVYSKVKENTSQTVCLKIDEGILKIMVDEKHADSTSETDQNKVLQTLIAEEPTHFEVFRNGILEQKDEIIYGIE